GEVDATDPGEHVLHEALVAGDVHDLDREPAGLLEEREAEVDRDATRLLLRQAVGVDAGQRLDQRGLAVVDVAGRPDHDVAGHGFASRRTSRGWGPAVRGEPMIKSRGSRGRRAPWVA